MVRDSLWLQPAEHYLMSLRYKRASGFGVNGGGDGPTGGIWIFEPADEGHPAHRTEAIARLDRRWPASLDPETNAPSRDGRYVYPFRRPAYHAAAMSVLRYVNSGGGRLGRSVRARARAR